MNIKSNKSNIKSLAGGGGMPPFVGYTPMGGIPANAPEVTPEQGMSSGDKGEGLGSLLNKDMVKYLYEKGLPTDVEAYIEEIAQLEEQIEVTGVKSIRSYKMALSKLSDVATQKSLFEKAIEKANQKNSLNEIAIDDYGRAYVIENDRIVHKRISDLNDDSMTLTNAQLAEFRVKNPKFAFDQSITQTINNSVSMENVNSKLWSQIKNIGTSEMKEDTFITKSKKEKIQKGIEALLGEGPDGVYKVSVTNSNQNEQINLALSYLYSGLTHTEKALLQEYARRSGDNSQEGAFKIIQSMVLSAANPKFSRTLDYQEGMSKSMGIGTNKDKEEKIEFNPIYSYWAGENGEQGVAVLNPGGEYAIRTTATNYAQLQDSSGKTIGPGSLRSMLNSGIGSMVDIQNGFYIGEQKVDTKMADQVMYTAEGGSRMILPFVMDSQGGAAPDFDILENYTKLQAELEKLPASATSKQAKDLYIKYGMEDYYTYDSQGNVVPNKSKFKPFLATNVLASGDAHFFGDDYDGVINPNQSNKYITNAKDTSLGKDRAKQILSKGLTTNKDNVFKPSGDIFLGVAYLPLVSDAGQALNASGQNPTMVSGDMTGIKDIRYVKGSQKAQEAVNSFNPQQTSKLGI